MAGLGAPPFKPAFAGKVLVIGASDLAPRDSLRAEGKGRRPTTAARASAALEEYWAARAAGTVGTAGAAGGDRVPGGEAALAAKTRNASAPPPPPPAARTRGIPGFTGKQPPPGASRPSPPAPDTSAWVAVNAFDERRPRTRGIPGYTGHQPPPRRQPHADQGAAAAEPPAQRASAQQPAPPPARPGGGGAAAAGQPEPGRDGPGGCAPPRPPAAWQLAAGGARPGGSNPGWGQAPDAADASPAPGVPDAGGASPAPRAQAAALRRERATSYAAAFTPVHGFGLQQFARSLQVAGSLRSGGDALPGGGAAR
ncbi:hypothetical protein HT031_002739 [Scenedesmus sp. PABB004]|nr:hypothetical protein HT031_002739 [Scenedesmus sp. PABB004]